MGRPEGTRSQATLSQCGTYRYELVRSWDLERPHWHWIDSTRADADQDDPTAQALRVLNPTRLRRLPGYQPIRLQGH